MNLSTMGALQPAQTGTLLEAFFWGGGGRGGGGGGSNPEKKKREKELVNQGGHQGSQC